MTTRLTVLYDEHCPICRAARRWLAGQDQLVRLEFVPAGSPEAGQRYPMLDRAQTLREVTVVADTGAVYTGDAAWLMCLWALCRYRGLALRLSRPGLRPLARRIVSAAAAMRERAYGDDYGRTCDERCDLQA